MNMDVTNYPVEVYTMGFSWRGTISLTARRRLSDFINDDGTHYLFMDAVTIALAERGATKDLTSVPTIALTKDAVLTLFCNLPVPQPGISNAEHIAKVPQRVMVYAHPFALIGNLHLTRDANWVDALNALRQRFVSLTDVTAWDAQSGQVVSGKSSFAAVRRLSIQALHPINSPQSSAIREPVFQSGSWARIRDVRTDVAEPKGDKSL